MKRILLAGAKRGKRLLALALTAAMLLTPFPALAPTTALAEEPAPAQRTIFANIGPGGFNAANTSRGLLDPNKTMFINGTKGTAGVLNADGTVGLTMATADAIAGSAFLSRRIYSETGFSARFEMRLGARGTDASDGWAFVVAKDTNKIGGTANSIGYEGIKNSFAFIYDTFYNRDRTEKVGTNNTNYVPQVQKATGGTYDYATAENLTASGSYGSVLAFPGKGLGGAANYSVFGWVDYDNKAGTMALYISLAPGEGEELTKPDEPISVFEGIDIEAVLGNQYYIGFTAASGRQQHILRQFYVFNESAPEVDFNGDGVGMNMSGGGEGGGGGEESAIIEDYTPPTAPVITQSESGMTDSLMVFSVGGSEDLNGVRKYQYRIGGETAWHDYAAGGEFVLDGSLPVTAAIAPGGEVTVSVRALDGGGNISDETSATLRYTIAPGPALTSPAIGAVNVFPANTLELGLSFKSKINVLTPGTVTVTASDGTTAQFAGGAVAAGDSRWDASQSKLTLPFALGDAGLGYGKNYTVTVSGFVNTSNIRMGDNDTPATESFTFSTIGREATPAASINFTNERLSGFSNNVIYRINGTEYTAASGAIPLQAAWLGTNIQIVKPGTAATVDSAAQTLTIPARRAAPIGLGSAVGPSKITGTTTDMEYAASASATSWITCAAPDTAVGEGTYYVRYKVTASGFKSEATTAEVMATTYTLNLTAPSFAAIAYGGGQPAAQALTITSSGNSNAAITNVSSTSGDFMISAGSAAVAAGGVNTSYTLQPAAGLGVGVHTATITVAYNGRTATTQVSMTVREATPVIGIDYVNEQLTNLTQGAVYTVNGTVYTASTGRLNIENAWLGTDISIIKTNANTALSSDILPLTVLPRSAPPTGLAATGEVYAGDNGALSGVLSTMEYRRPGAAWISGTDSGDIANLAPAEYQVRYKAKAVADATFSSRATALTITASRNYKLTAAVSADPAGQEGKVTTGYLLVTFEHANGVNAGVPVAGLPIAGSSADPGVYVSGDASAGTVGDDGDTDDKTWRVNIYPTMAGGAGTATLTFNPWTAANGNTYTVTPNPASVTVYKVVTEVTPTASVNYADERLDGLDAGATYKINGAARTADGAGHIPLGEFIPKAGDADQSRSLIIVKAGTDTSVDSPAQEAIAIPRRPATPEVNVTRQPSSETAPNDTGAITIGDFAPSAAYEYGPLNTSTGTVGPGGWSDFPSATPSGITDLTPDIYYARVKATGTSFASDSRSFQIYGFDTIDFGGVYVGYAVSDNPTDTRGANKAVTQRVRVEAGETITAAQWVDYSDPTFPVLLFPPEIDDLPFTLAGSGADWTVRPRNGLADAENPYEAWLMVTYGVASDTVVNRVSLQVHPRAEIVSVTQSGTDAKGATNEIKVTFVRPIDLAYTDVTVDGAAVKTIGETDFADVSSDKTVYKIAVTPLMDHKTNDDINVRINIDGDDLRPTYYFQNSNGEHGVAGSASVAIPRAILSAEAVTPIPGYSTGYIQFTLDRDLCPIDTAAIEEALGSVEIKVGGTLLPPGQIFRIDADMGYTFRLRITPTMSGNVTLAIPGFGITGTFAVDGSVSATGRELTDNAFFLSENGSNYLTGGADARQTL
ncbi:MAG: hypothetical protein LBK56_00995, partial [Gracilibacteraceae bacterium]|nr:hypothetical protein [Gracilibacteraceae bacterium]